MGGCVYRNLSDVEALTKVAQVMGPLGADTVVVGGSIWSYLTPNREPNQRSGIVTIQIASWADHGAIATKLAQADFQEVSGRPHYRRWADRDIFVEVFSTANGQAGVANPWFKPLREEARHVDLPDGSTIRLIDPVHFLAARLYDIVTWGVGNLQQSEEVRDVLLLVLCSDTLARDIEKESDSIREFIRDNLQLLVEVSGIEEVMGAVVRNACLGSDQLALLQERLNSLQSGITTR